MSDLYQGNCLDFIKNFKDASIDLIVTDPPYKVTSYGCSGNAGGMIAKKQTMAGKIFEHNDIEPIEYAEEFYRLLKDGSHCYVRTNHVNLINMLNSFTRVGFHFIKSLIWKKDNKIMGGYYMSQFEYILFFRKGVGIRINNCGTSDVLEVPNVKSKSLSGENLHDTEKPVELMRILVENSSKIGDTVLDPFMGIGSTGIACQLLRRNFIGIELDETYFKIARERILQVSSPDDISVEGATEDNGLNLNSQYKLF